MTERGGSPSPPVDGTDRGQTLRDPPAPYLPEDIWHHIHSLMPMRDAARAACLSRSFLHSWRCRTSLSLWLDLLCPEPRHKRRLRSRMDRILRNHLGVGLKMFELDLSGERSTLPYIDGWLQIALTPGIEELVLVLHKKYSIPCSLLSGRVGGSIRYLRLGGCAFRPTAEQFGPLSRLTSLHLHSVGITGDELECLLSNSPALEKLRLSGCKEMSSLKIPCMLLQHLRVTSCGPLHLIECASPNLSTIDAGSAMIRLAAEALQMKCLRLSHPGSFCHAFSELPPFMPNLERLTLYSEIEEMEAPMPTAKFHHLRHLGMGHGAFPPSYDYLSLATYLSASPSLETLFLDVFQEGRDSALEGGGSSDLRQLPEHRYGCLRKVELMGFYSAKTLVELTCCIVKNAASLEWLVLNTLGLHDTHRCFGDTNETCWPISEYVRRESSRALVAIRRHIEGKVPPTAELSVVEACSRCHAVGAPSHRLGCSLFRYVIGLDDS